MKAINAYCPEECKIVVDGHRVVGFHEEFLEEIEDGFTLRLQLGSESTNILDYLSMTGKEVDVSIEVGLFKEGSERITEYDIHGTYSVYRIGCKLGVGFPIIIYEFTEI